MMKGTLFLRFAKRSDAQAYVAAINAHSMTAAGEPFAAEWYPRQDTEGFWCAPLYGPPFSSATGEQAEPAGFADLHDSAETVDALYWPEE